MMIESTLTDSDIVNLSKGHTTAELKNTKPSVSLTCTFNIIG